MKFDFYKDSLGKSKDGKDIFLKDIWPSNKDIEDFINDIRAIKNQPFRMLLGSAHQMGTARMNPDPNLGVTDIDGKVHGLDNVYVVDSSVFPRCSGVNPMVTIQSTSHFLMSKI